MIASEDLINTVLDLVLSLFEIGYMYSNSEQTRGLKNSSDEVTLQPIAFSLPTQIIVPTAPRN